MQPTCLQGQRAGTHPKNLLLRGQFIELLLNPKNNNNTSTNGHTTKQILIGFKNSTCKHKKNLRLIRTKPRTNKNTNIHTTEIQIQNIRTVVSRRSIRIVISSTMRIMIVRTSIAKTKSNERELINK